MTDSKKSNPLPALLTYDDVRAVSPATTHTRPGDSSASPNAIGLKYRALLGCPKRLRVDPGCSDAILARHNFSPALILARRADKF
jgi:hypothetical protein